VSLVPKLSRARVECPTLNSPQIRLFGDPQVHNGNDIPILSVTLTVQVELPRPGVERLPSSDVVPDFVDGWAFGDAIGIFLRNYSPDRWVINSATLANAQVSCFLFR